MLFRSNRAARAAQHAEIAAAHAAAENARLVEAEHAEALTATVEAAARYAADADKPVVFMLSPEGRPNYTDDELGTGRLHSWGEDAYELASVWEHYGVELPMQLMGITRLTGYRMHEKLRIDRDLEALRAAFTAAGLTTVDRQQTSDLLLEHIGPHAAEQRARVTGGLAADVEGRIEVLLAGSQEHARTLEDTGTGYRVVSVGTDRIVFAGGTVTRRRVVRTYGLLRELAPVQAEVSASCVFLAGQQVTADADRDGSVRIRVADRKVVVSPADARAVLAAIGAATTIAQQ